MPLTERDLLEARVEAAEAELACAEARWTLERRKLVLQCRLLVARYATECSSRAIEEATASRHGVRGADPERYRAMRDLARAIGRDLEEGSFLHL